MCVGVVCVYVYVCGWCVCVNAQSHPGKIVERHWYERNKHIFPASRWEVVRLQCMIAFRLESSCVIVVVTAKTSGDTFLLQYDPAVKRDKYTIHGDEIR